MQNKSKFKVGDEAIYFQKRVEDQITLQKCEITMVFEDGYMLDVLGIFGLNRVSVGEDDLLTKEEALIKLQEFLNAK